METCSNCTFFLDLRQSQFTMPDDILTRCLKESRCVSGWPLPINEPEIETCDFYTPYNDKRFRWEWGEDKNKQNLKKHSIDFNEAIQAYENDPKRVRVIAPPEPTKWEDLKVHDFDKLGIEKNAGNLDPVRDWHFFTARGKIWKMVTTLRGEHGLMVQRVISVHRAKEKEIEMYHQGIDR